MVPKSRKLSGKIDRNSSLNSTGDQWIYELDQRVGVMLSVVLIR